ncbi:MAG TPA: hypothetical protein VFR94_12780 [Nitrososphaeraceae archaeon]|nr:hypothetical protein [Nitrososphaeraceae archaeon]
MISRTIRVSVLLLSIVAMTLSFSHSLYIQNNIVAYAQTLAPSLPSPDTAYPTIQIVSPHDSQLVPPGELTIQGISSDNEETDCQVYADVNDLTPMLRVTAAGDSGEALDFSKWTFTYTQDYQLIKEGENELTVKISCFDDGALDLNPFPTGTAASDSPLSEWHTINVTASLGAPPVSLPLPMPTVGDTEALTEEEEEGEDDSDDESNEESNEESEGDDDSDNDGSGSDGDDSSDEEDGEGGNGEVSENGDE